MDQRSGPTTVGGRARFLRGYFFRNLYSDKAEPLFGAGPSRLISWYDSPCRRQVDWAVHTLSRDSAHAYFCARAVQVRLEMTTTLPRWLNPSTAPAELREQWEEFADAMRRHEEVHKVINLAGAHDVLRKVSSISPRSCAELDRRTRAVTDASVQHFATENARYDRDTVGGRSDGVVWPSQPAIRLPS